MNVAHDAKQVSTTRVAELTEREERAFFEARKRSVGLWQEARHLLPMGVPSSFQAARPQPVFIDQGQGSRIWDVDGNEYVDFHNGFGVMVVGHAHPLVVAAVNRRVAAGTHLRRTSPGASSSPSGASPTAAPSPRWMR